QNFRLLEKRRVTSASQFRSTIGASDSILHRPVPERQQSVELAMSIKLCCSPSPSSTRKRSRTFSSLKGSSSNAMRLMHNACEWSGDGEIVGNQIVFDLIACRRILRRIKQKRREQETRLRAL
ncbi:hypothetical protein PENTCL1PPCAC_3841, partial [Pristionchus entomophagus]